MVVIYFSAPHRVDFRALVRDLAGRLRSRVELRQIGPRDEARLQGGIGPCGRDLCCATFLKDFEPVSVRMAKDQDLPVNPLRIAGACGRLMCCLKYEHPLYQEFHEQAPKIGEQVESPEGPGTVIGHNVPSDTVVMKLTADGRRCACSRASVCGSRQAYEAKYQAPEEAAGTGGGGGSDRDLWVRNGLLRRLALACGVAVLAGCSAAPAAGHQVARQSTPAVRTPTTLAGYYAQKLHWTPCDNGFQCARLLVPFDYSRPAWKRFSLPVIKLPAVDPGHRIGSLVVNPGGPGESGVQYAQDARSALAPAVLDRFDVIGFDPRGVGGSQPAVHCMSGPRLDKYFDTDDTPDTPAQLARVVSESRLFARECARARGLAAALHRHPQRGP